MLGVLANTVMVLIGGLIGCLVGKRIPQRITSAVMMGLGLCTVYIGLDGMRNTKEPLVLIASIAVGCALGAAIDIDDKLHKAARAVERRFRRDVEGPSLAEGMVTGSLFFCVGAMTVVGSLNAGFGDHTMLFTKSMLDFVLSIMLSVSLGYGVMLSAVVVFVLQGSLALFATWLVPLLSASLIAEITGVGSLMVVAVGLNLTGIVKIKVADFLPGLLLVPLFYFLFSLIPL